MILLQVRSAMAGLANQATEGGRMKMKEHFGKVLTVGAGCLALAGLGVTAAAPVGASVATNEGGYGYVYDSVACYANAALGGGSILKTLVFIKPEPKYASANYSGVLAGFNDLGSQRITAELWYWDATTQQWAYHQTQSAEAGTNQQFNFSLKVPALFHKYYVYARYTWYHPNGSYARGSEWAPTYQQYGSPAGSYYWVRQSYCIA